MRVPRLVPQRTVNEQLKMAPIYFADANATPTRLNPFNSIEHLSPMASRPHRQTSETPVPRPAAEVTGADLKDLRESLEHSSRALGIQLQDGLGSLGGRIELLEDNVRMVKARALSRSALDAVSAAAAAATAPAGPPLPAVAPADDSHIEQILASVLGDEIPMVRRNLEGVKDRVASLEAALEAAAAPGLSAEEAAAAAADAARQANEETQARMIAEMSALEERMDRRAREEARRAREEREAAEARGSMRRVSATVSAYTSDLATRLEGLRSEHEQQGAVVSRTAEEVAAAEASLRDFGSELVGLGQVANSVSSCTYLVAAVQVGLAWVGFDYGRSGCSRSSRRDSGAT